MSPRSGPGGPRSAPRGAKTAPGAPQSLSKGLRGASGSKIGAQRPPGSHFGAILAPCWPLSALIFKLFSSLLCCACGFFCATFCARPWRSQQGQRSQTHSKNTPNAEASQPRLAQEAGGQPKSQTQGCLRCWRSHLELPIHVVEMLINIEKLKCSRCY